jgi:hypothetical protein
MACRGVHSAAGRWRSDHPPYALLEEVSARDRFSASITRS